jgi:hypothetical protein
MKYKLNRNAAGDAVSAVVTLTPREAGVVMARRVDLIYSPGGLGPDMPDENGVAYFGGACFVDLEQNLIACLKKFGDALKAEIKWQDANSASIKREIQAERDEAEGFSAFPGGRWSDALRGTKSFPNHARCPFRNPDRVAAWERGYERAMEGCNAAAYEDAA